MPTKSRRTAAFLLATAALVSSLAFVLLRPTQPTAAPLSEVTMAVPVFVRFQPIYTAIEQGLFERAGVKVNITPTELGKDAIALVLAGKADLAIAADTPFMYAALSGQDIALISGLSRTRGSMAVVVRTDRGIRSVDDLKGKTIALTFGTNQQYMLDSFLQVNRIPVETVKRENLRTADILLALTQGRIDGAVLFGAHLVQMQSDMGDKLKMLPSEDAFDSHDILIARASYVDSHAQELQRVLRAIYEAIALVQAQPDAARRKLAQQFNLSDANVRKIFDPSDFELSLDQGLLLGLDDQARWAIAQGLARPGPVPNFVQHIKSAPLEAVRPAAVQIVR